MKEFKRLTLALTAVLLLILITACGGNTDNGNAANTGGDNVTGDGTEPEVVLPEPETTVITSSIFLDPAILDLDDKDSLMIAGYVYDTLVRQNPDGTIVPGLAQSWSLSDDKLTYTFRLRSDALFNDGTPIDSKIIAENFNRWFDPEHELHGEDSEAYQAWIEYFKGFKGEEDADGNPLSLFDGADYEDNLTVLLHVNEHMPDFLEIISMAFFSILNPDAVGTAGYGTMGADVVGSGPYDVSEWTDEQLILILSSTYWGTLPEKDLVFTFE